MGRLPHEPRRHDRSAPQDEPGSLPPVADEAKLATYLEAGKPENRQAVFDSLDATVLPPVIERQQEPRTPSRRSLTAAAAGRKTVDQALADAQKAVDALLT